MSAPKNKSILQFAQLLRAINNNQSLTTQRQFAKVLGWDENKINRYFSTGIDAGFILKLGRHYRAVVLFN